MGGPGRSRYRKKVFGYLGSSDIRIFAGTVTVLYSRDGQQRLTSARSSSTGKHDLHTRGGELAESRLICRPGSELCCVRGTVMALVDELRLTTAEATPRRGLGIPMESG